MIWGGSGHLVVKVNINLLVMYTVVHENAKRNWNWKKRKALLLLFLSMVAFQEEAADICPFGYAFDEVGS